MVIDEKNVKHTHMQAIEHCVETRIPLGNVSMGVDRIQQRERPHLTLEIGCIAYNELSEMGIADAGCWAEAILRPKTATSRKTIGRMQATPY
jgi:hypothetical protein